MQRQKKNNAFINCVVNDSKKSRFNKEQETSGLLNNLGLKTPLSKIPILSNILLWRYNEWNSKQVLLAGNTFMHEKYLCQPEFMHSVCRPFTKNKEKIK